MAAAGALLRLRGFSAMYLHDAALLELLPTSSLTRLVLSNPGITPPSLDRKPIADAVARLTGLQELALLQDDRQVSTTHTLLSNMPLQRVGGIHSVNIKPLLKQQLA